MPRNIAPANISSSRDLVEYHVSDASAVHPNAPPGYIERYIHSEIYKKYSAVNSVIHSHAGPVVPYSISSVPLKPCLHMAGFLGSSTPVYDVAKHYRSDDTRDLLIRNAALGESLGIEICVSRAVYTKENAAIQTASLGLRAAYHDSSVAAPGIDYLHDDEIEGTTDISRSVWARGWGLWLREVEAANLYTSSG